MEPLDQVLLAAALGDEAAQSELLRQLNGSWELHEENPWTRKLVSLHQRHRQAFQWVKAACVGIVLREMEPALLTWEHRFPKEKGPHAALASAKDWLACPCRMHSARAREFAQSLLDHSQPWDWATWTALTASACEVGTVVSHSQEAIACAAQFVMLDRIRHVFQEEASLREPD